RPFQIRYCCHPPLHSQWLLKKITAFIRRFPISESTKSNPSSARSLNIPCSGCNGGPTRITPLIIPDPSAPAINLKFVTPLRLRKSSSFLNRSTPRFLSFSSPSSEPYQ